MAVAYTTQNRALTVSLSGELDHHRVKGVIRELEGEIDRLLPQQLVVDCAGVTFMDSAGIAILLRLWQRMEELGGVSTSGTCRSSRGGCSGRRAWPGSSPPNPSRKGVTHSHADHQVHQPGQPGLSLPVGQRGLCPQRSGVLCGAVGPHPG